MSEPLAYQMKDIVRLTGKSERTIERDMKRGAFPKPILNFKPPMWSRGQVDQWLAERTRGEGA